MKTGTKSLLFGCHQVLLHPVFVLWAWVKLYSFQEVREWGGPDEGKIKEEEYTFHVNFAGLFVMWNVHVEVTKENTEDFSWNPAMSNIRFLNGTLDKVLCMAIALCLKKNIKNIYQMLHGGSLLMKNGWSFPVIEAVRHCKEIGYLKESLKSYQDCQIPGCADTGI